MAAKTVRIFPTRASRDASMSDFKAGTTIRDYDGVMAKYHQQIFAIDVAVGMIRDELEKSGVADNTVVIFSSDNGFFCGSHGYGSKVLPYEESARAPLIVFDPRHKNSRKELRCGALTGNIDFAPTMLELAGLPIPRNMDGKSLLPLLEDPQGGNTHESMPLINVWGPRATHSLAIITRNSKYILWNYAADGFEPAEELYDLSEDPLELKNIAGKSGHRDLLSSMRKKYDAAVEAWKQEAVPYHRYQPFGSFFERKEQ